MQPAAALPPIVFDLDGADIARIRRSLREGARDRGPRFAACAVASMWLAQARLALVRPQVRAELRYSDDAIEIIRSDFLGRRTRLTLPVWAVTKFHVVPGAIVVFGKPIAPIVIATRDLGDDG